MLAKAVAYSLPTTTIGITAAGATEITVTALTGFFPTLLSGEHTYAILSSDETFSDPEANYETVKITAIDDTDPYVLTVVKNQESTTGAGQEWADGTAIMVGITAVAWEEMVNNVVYGNWDGGKADSVYGGMDSINGGNA